MSCLVVLAAVCAAGAASAQPRVPAVAPGNYGHRVWTTSDGLPQNHVNAVVQTRDGFLWLGTGSGLVRFDGLSFLTFDVTTIPALPTNWIGSLYEDAEGTLWIGTDDGVLRYRNGVFTHDRLGDEFDHRLVMAIVGDRDGRVWMATPRQVLRRDAQGWSRIMLGDVRIRDLAIDADNVLWIATIDGVIQWRDGIIRTFTTRDGLPGGDVNVVYPDRAGRLWAGTPQGLVSIDRATGKMEPLAALPPATAVLSLFEDRDGVLWIGAHRSVYALSPDGRLTGQPLRAGENKILVTAITADRDGQLWLGVAGRSGGLHRLTPPRLTTWTREDGLPCDNVASVTEAADGTVWVGTFCSGRDTLAAIRGGRLMRERDIAEFPQQAGFTGALLAEPEGGLWFGTFSGELTHLKDGRATRFTMTDSGLVGRHVVALYRDAGGALWIGTERGLNRYYAGHWSTLRREHGLVDNDVRVIAADREGTIWIGTAAGVSRYNGGRFTNLTRADGLPPGAVRAIHFDADNTVWIGTYGGGLARVKQERVTRFGTQGGLLDIGVHRILEDEAGYLWMSGDRGIRRVSRRELNDVAEGRSTRLTVTIYDEADGMKSAEGNGMAQPAGWRMRDGSLWFPTQGGLVRIDSASERVQPVSPPIAIDAVLVDGTKQDATRAIVAPAGANELEIHYTAPALMRPEQIQFRYRLEGHDSDWIDAGTRRAAYYTNLEPGQYRFKVIARSSTGLWTEQDAAAVGLMLQPYFHQRLLVRIGALLLVIAAVSARIRTVRQRRRAQSIEAAVAQRTAELRQEHEGLSSINQQLSEANGQLSAAKSAADTLRVHLLAMFDQLGIGVIVVDLQGQVLFLSDSIRRLMAVKDFVGRPLAEVLPVSPATLAELRSAVLAPPSGARIAARLEPEPEWHFWKEIEVRVDPYDEHHRVLYLYDAPETYELGQTRTDRAEPGPVLIGTSPAMRFVHAQIQIAAGVDETVLIEGETGTGKELVARAIHGASRRRGRPLVAINCVGSTESVLASQLFGHVRGAFNEATLDLIGLFEAVQGGTVVLDEIGDMPSSIQAHIVLVLKERVIVRLGESRVRPIDVRVLATTHRNLDEEVARRRFREDLLLLLRATRITVPPLCQRAEDIPVLAETFVAAFAAAHGKHIDAIGPDTMARLIRHHWPGNVRELKSTIEWAVVHARTPVIEIADLPRPLTIE